MTAELPITRVTNVTRALQAAAASGPGVTSAFTGTQQPQDWGGRWWSYEIEFAVLQDADGRRLSAFFAALGGVAGTFTFRDPYIRNPVGLGAPSVNGAGQAGTTLVTDGWGARGMSAGDFFSLGSGTALRLHQLTADAVPVAGAATLQFVPALRASPADNAALNVVNPGVLLRASGPIPAQIGLADLYRFSLQAREAI
jgi:hypothetical protein